MKKDRILNPELIAQIASIGHTEYLVIADAGLPIPAGVKVIDLSVVRGLPGFLQVLDAVNEELVTEAYILASEMPEVSPQLYHDTCERLEGRTRTLVSHETLKEMTRQAKAVIRTGETTSYANVILVAGVNF